MLKKTLIVSVIVLVLIQFFKPEKNISNVNMPMAIEKHYNVPANVNNILTLACKDCHSNNTRYPWYSNIQPFSWFLSRHVKGGKKHLNFDEFITYSLKKQDHKLEELIETQQEGSMPLSSYTIIHRNAVLTHQQKQELINWARSLRSEIDTKLKNQVEVRKED